MENYGNILIDNTEAKFIVLRVTNVYGGEASLDRVNGFIDKYISCFKNNSVMQIYSNKNNTYDWIHINDVITAIIACIEYNQSNTFLIGNGKSYSLNNLLNILETNIGIVKLDMKEISSSAVYVMIDPSKSKDLLGWKSQISLSKGLQIIKKTL